MSHSGSTLSTVRWADGGAAAADSTCSSNDPPKGPTKGLWASSSRKKQAGAPNPTCLPGCRLHSGCQPSLRWSPDYTWLSHSLFL